LREGENQEKQAVFSEDERRRVTMGIRSRKAVGGWRRRWWHNSNGTVWADQ
jgi:hypothetical protein